MNEGQFSAETVLVNAQGLHARPSSMIVRTANKFDASVILTIDGRSADCKSIMEVMMLASPMGTPLRFDATGREAEGAVSALVALIQSGFGEAT